MDFHGLTWLYAQKLSWIWILSTNLENPSICLVTSFSQVKNGGLLLLPVLLWLSIIDAPPRVFWVSFEINQFESDDVQPWDMPIWSRRHQALRSTLVVILGASIPFIQFWPYTRPWMNKVIKSGHWSSETRGHLLNVTCLCVLQSVSYVAIDVQICTITGQFTSSGQRELIYLKTIKWSFEI